MRMSFVVVVVSVPAQMMMLCAVTHTWVGLPSGGSHLSILCQTTI